MKIIENFHLDNRTDSLIKETGQDQLIIRNGVIDVYETDPNSESALVGIDIRKCQLVEISNVIVLFHEIKRKYSYGIRSGYANTPTEANKKVLIANTKITGLGPLNAGYNLNRDCIASEGGDELWLKNCVLDGATDACIDCKTKNLKVVRTLLANSYRLSRGWAGVNEIFVDCVFDTTGDHLWNYDQTTKITLVNTKFQQIRKVSYDQAPTSIITLTTSPLTDPWFLAVPPAPEPTPVLDFTNLILAQENQVKAAQGFLAALRELGE